MKTVVLYALFDPASPADVRYIGITNNPKNRLRCHIHDSVKALERAAKGDDRRSYKDNWIISVIEAGRKPQMRVLALLAPCECQKTHFKDCVVVSTEQRSIAVYLRDGYRLTNGTEGGERVIYTPEAKERLRAGLLRPEVRARISEASRAHNNRPEVKKQASVRSRSLWKDPYFRDTVIASLKESLATPEAKKKKSKAMRKARSTPESRLKTSAISKVLWQRQGYREVLKEKISKRNKALWRDQEYRRKQKLGLSPEKIAKQAAGVRAFWANASPERREERRKLSKEIMSCPERKKKHVERMKRYFSDPVNRKKHSIALKEALNRPEVKVRRKATLAKPEVRQRLVERAIEVQSRAGMKEKISAGVARFFAENPEARRRTAEQLLAAAAISRQNPEMVARRLAAVRAASSRPDVRRRRLERQITRIEEKIAALEEKPT